MKKKITLPKISYGVLGNLSGVVLVPNKNNFVYVRLQDNRVTSVFNTRVPPTYGTPVVIGIDPLDPGLPQVLSIRSSLNDASGTLLTGSGYAPAKRYRWMADGGGQDPLFAESRQIMPLRMYSSGGMNIDVYPGLLYTLVETWVQVSHQTVDLTAYIPVTAASALFVLISLDNTGTIITTVGSEVLYANLSLTDIPEVPDNATIVLGAVRLYTGQTNIYEGRSNTDIVDFRFPSRYKQLVDWEHITNKPAIYRGTLFLHEETSGIGTYDKLLEIPANDAEDEDSQTVTAADGEVLLDGYITEVLNTVQIPDGAWEFKTYAKVSSAVGLSEIIIRVYKRASGGTETELFNTTTGEINATSATLYTTILVQPDFAVLATDRLLIKYFAKTSSVVARTVTLYHEGVVNYSHIHTPFMFGDISGDLMKKSVYDANLDGTIDSANATLIDGIEVDLAGIADTNALVYDAGTNKIVAGEAVGGGGSGDMTKAVYDTDDDGVVDSAESTHSLIALKEPDQDETLELYSTMLYAEIIEALNSVNHYIAPGKTLTIHFNDGEYTQCDNILISDFFGGGNLYISGNVSEALTKHTNQAVHLNGSSKSISATAGFVTVEQCACVVYVKNIKVTSGTTSQSVGLLFRNCSYVRLEGCYLVGSNNTVRPLAFYGIGYAYIFNEYISGGDYGIWCRDSGTHIINLCESTGTLPLYGVCAQVSQIRLVGLTFPTGSTANYIKVEGGDIAPNSVRSTPLNAYNGKFVTLDGVAVTADRTITMPDASGTMALTDDLNDYTPIAHVGSGGAAHADVTTSVDGFMTAADKAKLDALGSTVGGKFIPLATPLTSTSWDGDARSTTAKTLIDLSAVFGVPAGVKSVLARTAVRDSGSAASENCWICLSNNNTANSGVFTRVGGGTNDYWVEQMGIIPCDKNGDIYFQTLATGAGTLDVYLEIWGYWIETILDGFVPLTTYIGHADWTADAKTTANNGTLDLSALFGVPAGIKAVLVRLTLQHSAAGVAGRLGTSSSYNYALAFQTQVANIPLAVTAPVPCDSNGDIYFSCSGNLDQVTIQILGYWL